VFRGWLVVLGAFGVLFVIFGCAYSFPAFFDILVDEFKGARGDVSLVFAIAGCLLFVVGAFSGPLSDRIDPRWIIGFGVILVGIGPIAASFATALWQVQLAMGVGIGVGVGCAYVPAVGPVQRWFVRRRGFASGMAVAGIGVGSFATPLIATAIMGVLDWRAAYQILGVGAIVLGLAATALIVASPERVGFAPDGASHPIPDLDRQAPPPAGMTRGEAIRSRPFLVLWLSSFVLSFPLFVPFVHLVPYTMDLGYEKTSAVFVTSLIGVGSIAGRFLMGGLADRLGRRESLMAMFVGLAAMYGLWLVSDSLWLLAVFALVYGSCYGGYVALVPAVAIDYLGGRNAGSIIGALYTSVAIGTLFGPPLAGYAYDLWSSYRVALYAGLAMLLLATAITFLLPGRATAPAPATQGR
jgi:MFS family permease